MEEIAIAALHTFAVLDLPVSVIGIVIGMFTAVWRPRARTVDPLPLLPERIGVGLCMALAVLGTLGILITILKREPPPTPLAALFAVLILLTGLPAVLWNSPWRRSAEGIATAALSIDAFLAGFSIGPLFVPLVLLMIWVCVQSIRKTWNESIPTRRTRVDSLP